MLVGRKTLPPFCAISLLAFTGGLAELYALRPQWETNTGMSKGASRMRIGMWVICLFLLALAIGGAGHNTRHNR